MLAMMQPELRHDFAHALLAGAVGDQPGHFQLSCAVSCAESVCSLGAVDNASGDGGMGMVLRGAGAPHDSRSVLAVTQACPLSVNR